MKVLILAAAMLAGCINTDNPGSGGGQQPSVKASYLCVGMEMSRRFGSCPGCELDAKRLSSLMKTRMGYQGKILISDQATKEEVVKWLKKGVGETPEDGLFLFFYSGHGGQEYLGGKEPDGADPKDEYLCLYDSHMLDDEIWEIVRSCKGRVFMYFDACHSATMYRSVASDIAVAPASGQTKATALAVNADIMVKSKGFTFRPDKFMVARPMDLSAVQSPRVLCWSGCMEDEYSYGGNNGGALTIAVINNWKQGISYDSLWEHACKDVGKSQPKQHPMQTYIGSFRPSVEAFR